jgi:hypothetical protein
MTNQPRRGEAGPADPEGRPDLSRQVAEPPDALENRRAWLAGLWAIVLRRFRDQVHGPDGRGLPRPRPAEED